jgi:hypothetical protein
VTYVTTPREFLETVAGYTRQSTDGSADRPCRIAVIDPAYATGNPKVTFEGESTMSAKGYPFLSSYTPVASERVVLLPIGTTYLILGKIDNGVNSIATKLDALPKGLIARVRSSASNTGIQTVASPQKDVLGDLAFTAVAGRNYYVSYKARVRCDSAAVQTCDISIKDGNASSPTSASTNIETTSIQIQSTAGTGATGEVVFRTLTCGPSGDIAAGTHTLAAFYARTVNNGVATVSVDSTRELAVYDMGTQSV